MTKKNTTKEMNIETKKGRCGKRIPFPEILLKHPAIGQILKELRELGTDKD